MFEAYLDNASYEAEADVAKAKLFLTACTQLLAFPEEAEAGSQKGSQRYKANLVLFGEQQQRVTDWLAANNPPSSTRTSYGDLSDYRV